MLLVDCRIPGLPLGTSMGLLHQWNAKPEISLFWRLSVEHLDQNVKKQNDTVFLSCKHVTWSLCFCVLIVSDQIVKFRPLLFLVSWELYHCEFYPYVRHTPNFHHKTDHRQDWRRGDLIESYTATLSCPLPLYLPFILRKRTPKIKANGVLNGAMAVGPLGIRVWSLGATKSVSGTHAMDPGAGYEPRNVWVSVAPEIFEAH